MNDNVVYLYPAHSPHCPVNEGDERVRWCPVVPGPDGAMVAARLGAAMPCLPLPVWAPRRWRMDGPEVPDGAA